MKKRRKRGREAILTFKKEIDGVKICRQDREKVFILPKGMGQENYLNWRQDNRNYLHKLKNQKS